MLTVSYFGFFYPLFCWLQIKAEQMPSLVGFLLKLTPVLDSQPGFWTHPHTAFWDSIFLDSPMDAQEVFASAAHLLPVIKIRRSLGIPWYSFMYSVLRNSCHLKSPQWWWVLLSTWGPSLMTVFLLPHIAFPFPHIRSHPSSDPHSLLFYFPFIPTLLGIIFYSSSSSLRMLSVSRWTFSNYFLLLPTPLPRPYLLTFSTGPPSV